MEQQNPLPPPSNDPNYYPPPVPTIPTPNQPPPVKLKKALTALVIVILLAGIIGVWYALSKKDGENEDTQVKIVANKEPTTDKEGIQKAVNTYCQELSSAYGFANMKSGYIISDRFSEDTLKDSPELLRFKQVGDAAYGTVDCENNGSSIGISNDLLFAKTQGTWIQVDEEQNNAGSGFLCSVADQYNISKELVSKCAPSEGARTKPR